MTADREDLDEFLNPETRGNSTFAVSTDDELIAFLSVTKVNGATYDIGLGMRPDLTGKGKGLEFVEAAIDFVKSEYETHKLHCQ